MSELDLRSETDMTAAIPAEAFYPTAAMPGRAWNRLGLYPAYLVKRYVHEILGVSQDVYEYHDKKGRLPKPSHPLGGKMYFNDSDVEQIIRYFDGRPKWMRQ